jgi:interferon-induced GTP-binding protein Mx
MKVDALAQQFNAGIRPLLDVVDSVRSMLGTTAVVASPLICCVGDQSSGKSSVLEALSGMPFPRGTGLVTRCACELRMKRSSSGWRAVAYTSEKGSKKYRVDCPEAMSSIVEQFTEKLCKSSASAFSSESIIIELESETCPDLTIVDLPGNHTAAPLRLFDEL